MSGGARLGLLVHHTDAEREYAYDRNTSFGRLDKALDAAPLNHWLVVDMKNDWKEKFSRSREICRASAERRVISSSGAAAPHHSTHCLNPSRESPAV